MIDSNVRDCIFRALFALIFVGLGFEHIFSDELLQDLMPEWVPYPRVASFLCGVWLLGWGGLIMVGWRVRWAGVALGAFLIFATLTVHLPGVLVAPISVNASCERLWSILQRSNLAKNLCLLGVCVTLIDYKVGRYSLERYLGRAG